MKKKAYVKYLLPLLLLPSFPALGATGWQQDAGQNWVYMQNDKMVTNNWVYTKEGKYRVKEDGTRYENEWFSITTKPSEPAARAATTWYYAGPDGKIYENGWYTIGEYQFYFYGGGSSARKNFVHVGENYYYVDENGARKGPGWFSVSGVNSAGAEYTNWYYAQPDGSLVRGGWHEVEGQLRYFDANGLNYRNRWFNLEGNRYYADAQGCFPTGWFSISGVNSAGNEYTNWYYADSNHSVWRGGWGQLGEDWYFFDPNGLSYRKRWYVDADGERYYMDENGILQDDGWFKIENTNASTGAVSRSWHYAQESGALLKGGFKEIDGKSYYFDNNGYNYRNRWIMPGNGDRYYVAEDGRMYQDEWFELETMSGDGSTTGNWYYAGSDGNVYMDGWHKIGDKSYYFYPSGMMRTGWFSESGSNGRTNYYYCKEDGARAVGWRYLEIPESWTDDQDVTDYMDDHGQFAWFYFNRTSGKKRYSDGGKRELEVEGKTYCIDDDGIMHYGWVKMANTTPEILGYRYFYDPESDSSSELVHGEEAASMWLEIEGPPDLSSGEKELYYFDHKGRPVCASEGSYLVREIHGENYIFDMYGAAQYGLVEVDGEFYYCGDRNGSRACQTGKVKIEDGIDSGRASYRFDLEGKGITGIKEGYFYYKGKLQRADSAAKYEVFEIPGEGKRLVNSSGKVMKNTTVTDRNGQKWVLGSRGQIEVYGSDEMAEILAPEAIER